MLAAALLGEQDVPRLHVEVGDRAGVQVRERVRHLESDGRDERRVERAAAEAVLQRARLHVLHDHEAAADVGGEGGAGVAHVDDVRVAQRRQQHDLALATGDEVGAAARGEELDRDVAVLLGVPGAVDVSHAAGPEHLVELVARRGLRHLTRIEGGFVVEEVGHRRFPSVWCVPT
ncbi:hypothetical protein [Desertivibrio insolitus]|uniref:hypothetical protein n=1 Tax=Herbiconiux sp. SYSU D00978 TaxID=2812562 RepID=UPI001A964E11|nr:hypothetical protein [Herbiconiux sp. SYSU D00978]